MSEFSRTELMLGEAALEAFRHAHVAVFGVGGVGGACLEALVRAGIGELSVFDADTVSISNINRQLIALHSTVGLKKTEAAMARALDINPALIFHANDVFFDAQSADAYPLDAYDYIVDAIDTVSSKLLLIERAKAASVPIVCCMGTGNKVDPSRFQITDIEKTSVCPLARVMRAECRRRGIKGLRVLWSDEPPRTPPLTPEEHGRHIPGSVSFVPPVAGFLLAGEVLRTLAGIKAAD